MSDQKNPLQGFLGNLKDKAEDLVENLAEAAEGAADKVIGEENVDKVKQVMSTDVGNLAGGAAEAIKDKAQDIAQDVSEAASGLKEKAEDLFKGDKK